MKVKHRYSRASTLIECLIAMVIVTCTVLTYSAWQAFVVHDTEKIWREIPTKWRTNAGFSLLECMLSISISMVVLTGAISFFVWFHQASLKLREVQMVTQEAMYLSLFFSEMFAHEIASSKQIMTSEAYNALQLTRKKSLPPNAVLVSQTPKTSRYYFVADTTRKNARGEEIYGLYLFAMGSGTQELAEQIDNFYVSKDEATGCWQFKINFALCRAQTHRVFSWNLCHAANHFQ